ncbi:FeoA domain-containing protein [Lactococcus termiticola]|uniref:Ferrous iron transporter A n=1 Tax=Lactococcus termiticola TaxID=2169526 RepID=A0A2R5HD50_9LACT|nr:FeoA domain-containing protein [Lactococcus termiticola]GBG96003.1 ferrous iron transporter A [Lactococcus termiticola]
MKTLDRAHPGQVYYVDRLLPGATKLKELGFRQDAKVLLVSLTGELAIVKVMDARLALDMSQLKQVCIKDQLADETLLGLDSLKAGETGIVRLIEAEPKTRHHLMDMGITRGTSIYVRKLAPMGDPMELHLRGYALSLRKADARQIKVVLQ